MPARVVQPGDAHVGAGGHADVADDALEGFVLRHLHAHGRLGRQAKRTSGRSKRPGIAVRSGARQQLDRLGLLRARVRWRRQKPAGMSVPVLRCRRFELGPCLPAPSLRVAPLSPSSATRYCVPRTPTTAVGVVASSGWLRLAWPPAPPPNRAACACCRRTSPGCQSSRHASVALGPRLATIPRCWMAASRTRSRRPARARPSRSRRSDLLAFGQCRPKASPRRWPRHLADAAGQRHRQRPAAHQPRRHAQHLAGADQVCIGQAVQPAISRRACGPVNTVSRGRSACRVR